MTQIDHHGGSLPTDTKPAFDSRFLRSTSKQAQDFESVAIKMSCFGFKSKKDKNSSATNPSPRDEASTRCNDSFSDMVTKQPAGSMRPKKDASAPQPKKSQRQGADRSQERPNKTVDVQEGQPDLSNLSNSASMHDSGSSFKEVAVSKDKLAESAAAPQRKALPDSVNTKPVEELDEDEAEAVLRPEWQINPLDIYFCSKKNNKLLKLGKGGFGTVYKGVWKGRTVAVKVCRQQHLTAKAMKQFQSEVAILNSCSHESVVEFIGACCWKGGKRTVLVTEFMEKGDLCTALGRAPHLYAWDNLGKSIALDVAKGLAFLHSRNVVHFDLKSANILLDRRNRAKLADVGLAKTLTDYHGEDHLSTFLATGDLGTFAWAAPEVLLGFSCNCKADIFSFGVLMWELATGEMPQGRALRPLRVPEEAPDQVAELIMNCLRHDPTKRPSAEELLKILGEIQ